jgi:hypothetical protein
MRRLRSSVNDGANRSTMIAEDVPNRGFVTDVGVDVSIL